MAKAVLGKKIKDRRVVTTTGLELGHVLDMYYEDTGEIVSFVVKPSKIDDETRDHVDQHNLMNVPFNSVKAIGRYIVVDFPFSQ
mgnify:CR=1 FL=1